MKEEQIAELEKLKSPVAKEAAAFIRAILQSPYLDSYITLYNQVSDWNSQLVIRDEDVEGVKVTKGRIDIFSDKDSKEFDRTFKYFSDITGLLNCLDTLREKMTPEQVVDIRNKDIVTHKDLKRFAFEKDS